MSNNRSKIISKSLLAAYAIASVTAIANDSFKLERNGPKPNKPTTETHKPSMVSGNYLYQTQSHRTKGENYE